MDSSWDDSEMGRSGSFAYLSKKSITNSLECLISCVILLAAIYIALLTFNLTSLLKGHNEYQLVGYISLIACLSAPIGLYGSKKSSYWALILFFVLASYHLYGLIMYLWLSIRSSDIFSISKNKSLSEALKKNGELHHVTMVAYTLVVIFSLILSVFKIISITLRLEPAKVIVVDNNPSD